MNLNKNNPDNQEQQTQQGCMKVTAFFVIVTALSVIVLIVLKRFLL
jgi:hypothetical protein